MREFKELKFENKYDGLHHVGLLIFLPKDEFGRKREMLIQCIGKDGRTYTDVDQVDGVFLIDGEIYIESYPERVYEKGYGMLINAITLERNYELEKELEEWYDRQ